MTYISACAAFMLHTVCLTSHCYRDQALLRLSVAVVVLWCVLPCVCVFHCCCCLMVLWSVHMAVVRSWCEGAGGPASGFKFLLGRFVPVYCGAKQGFSASTPAAAQPAAALRTGVRIPLSLYRGGGGNTRNTLIFTIPPQMANNTGDKHCTQKESLSSGIRDGHIIIPSGQRSIHQ